MANIPEQELELAYEKVRRQIPPPLQRTIGKIRFSIFVHVDSRELWEKFTCEPCRHDLAADWYDLLNLLRDENSALNC
ncbi:hypothetical protein VTN02DRAFT_528 [Thermoascus thermophilus]